MTDKKRQSRKKWKQEIKWEPLEFPLPTPEDLAKYKPGFVPVVRLPLDVIRRTYGFWDKTE